MGKVNLKLTINIQAEGADIINQNIRIMSESLDEICKEIIPKEASYQAKLENLLTGSIVEQEGRAKIRLIPTSDVQPDNKWISVDERLPKPFERVLCYCISTSGDDAYMIGCIDKHWGLLKGETFVFEKDTNRIVAYWQPLPSRPTIDYCRFCTECGADYKKKEG